MIKRIITISTGAQGGIKSVVENYIQSGLFKQYNGKWLISHKEGSLLTRLYCFISCFIRASKNIISGNKVFHIHMAMKGSFFRKMILIYWIKLFQGKVILHLHGSEFEVFYNNRGRFLKRIIARTFEIADIVLVLSKSWQTFISSLSPNIKVIVLPNYVEPVPISNISTDTNKVTFVFLGAIGKRKGIYDLLPAFTQLLKSVPQSKLIICGDGELTKAKKMVKQLGISKQVDFAGWVTGDEKNHFLNIADVVILPSYNEGLPMVILEAMSLGKCVLSTKVGGIPEAIQSGENGLLIDAGNIEQLTKAMHSLCEIQTRIALGKKGRETYIRLYSNEAVIPQLRKIYDSLL
jgi:glycosyltransferase involved in cell wall biosynthesis